MAKVSSLIFFTSLCCVLGNYTYYSSYYGTKLSSDEVAQYAANSTLANCTNKIATCDASEGRRIDGTCNNLDYPSYGATHTPHYRILEADFYQPTKTKFEPKRSVTGAELELVRAVRTKIWAEGRADDDFFASIILHIAVLFNTDITNTLDTRNYAYWRPYCCKKEGLKDYACVPHKVPPNDFVHRFTGIDCLNFTRPLTYQSAGCLPHTTTPLRIVDRTPMFDLSNVYDDIIDKGRRTFSGGKMFTVTVNNRIFPDQTKNTVTMGINFFGIIFFWRHHNFIATELASLNPCWTDEQLFVAARDINIAVGVQIFYYELMATFMGYDNLVKDGVLSDIPGFRDVYDSNVLQQIALEFPVALRWLHSLQDGEMSNAMVSCGNIPALDFSTWVDSTCSK